MMTDPRILAALTLLFASPGPALHQADKIYEDNSPAVVTIYCNLDPQGGYKTQGSGSILRSDGIIVTNYHVIDGASSYSVRIGEHPKSLLRATLLYTQPSKDYALLKVEAPGTLPVVKLGDPHKLKEGQKVYLIGSPQGLENTISDGLVSSIRESYSARYAGAKYKVQLKNAIQISAPMSPGSSGGAAFNEQGEIVGITTFSRIGGENLNFAVPIDVVCTIDDQVLSLNEALRRRGVKLPEESLCDRGRFLREQKRLKEAAEIYQKAVAINKDCSDAHLGLGATYYEMGVYRKAQEALKIASALAPEDPAAHYYLGLTFKETEEPNPAIEELEKAAAFGFRESFAPLKEAYGAARRPESEVERLKAAVASNPESGEAHLKLGLLYKSLLEDDLALESFKKAADLAPKSFEAHKSLGDLHLRAGRTSEAVAAYAEAVRLKPDDVAVHFNLAQTYLARFAASPDARDRAGLEREAETLRKWTKSLGKYLQLKPVEEACFLAGTRVLLEDGRELPIERLTPGDRLRAFTPEGTMTSSTVRKTILAQSERYFEMETASTSVRVTPAHPFFDGAGGFRTAEALAVGDCIYLWDGNRMRAEPVLRKWEIESPASVYNLTADLPHTYFANGIAVHNK